MSSEPSHRRRSTAASAAPSMHEITPSPIEDTPTPSSTKTFNFSPSPSSPPSRPTTLGLSGHGAVWWLSRIQRYSSYTFSAFLAAHAVNTGLIPLVTKSVPASDTYLLLTRPYYQSFPLEPLLLTLPLAAHLVAGLALRLHRRRTLLRASGAETSTERQSIPWPKLSGTSALGYALTPLVLAHAFVNRGLPLLKEGGSSGVGLGFVSHGFAKHPVLAWGVYSVLLGVGVGHVVWGWARWMGVDGRGGRDSGEREGRRKLARYVVNGVWVALAGVWAAGGLGVVGRAGAAGGWKGREWDEIYRAIPVVGGWL
ncbi:MAG: hypothetical protein MMC23_000179 [Stictis urceolatum]|nr:hypothetical protein [Stictis urceolata]